VGLVLVVEDDPAIAAQVEAILTSGGHRVILATVRTASTSRGADDQT
jgi:DNA-binding response OmpR family regulator